LLVGYDLQKNIMSFKPTDCTKYWFSVADVGWWNHWINVWDILTLSSTKILISSS
jgi:hypothetical protein